MTLISLNGIRLSRDLVMVKATHGGHLHDTPFFRTLADQRINMVNVGGHTFESGFFFACCLEPETRAQHSLFDTAPDLSYPVSLISLYPHGEDGRVPLLALDTLGKNDIPLHHMTSSHAVVSLVIPTEAVHAFISALEKRVSLPDSHTPYVQEVEMDIGPILRKYPETRSAYVEEKIKTYGIQLMEDLSMVQWEGGPLTDPSRDGCHAMDQSLDTASKDNGFVFVSVLGEGQGIYIGRNALPHGTAVDFIRFHGPHFGDRFRILQTAVDCLGKAKIHPLCLGCTGASLAFAFAKGRGRAAQIALEKGFEAP